MKGDQTTSSASPSFSETIATILYPVFMAILMALMIGTAIVAVSVVYYSRAGITEPDWINISRPIVSALAGVYDPREGDASRMLDTVYISVTALVMGVFLRRCSGHYGAWEVGIVLSLLGLATVHLVAYSLLPDDSATGEQIGAGKEYVGQLKLLLVRNSNVALAVFAAAIGIQFDARKSVSSGPPQQPVTADAMITPPKSKQDQRDGENGER